MSEILPICLDCKNFISIDRDNNIKCKAFDNVPDEIYEGKNNHSKPLDDQLNDIVFEPKDKPKSK